MTSAPLTSDLIGNPALWRLYLEVTPRALELVAYSTLDDQSLIHRRLPFDPAASTGEQALSSLVYENELLLADFSRTGILIDTPRFMVVPEEIPEEMTAAMASKLWGDDITLLSDSLPLPGVKLITAADKGVAMFLRRTYPTVTPHHPMAQLITYFYNKDRMNNVTKMYVHLRDSRIDIIIFNGQRLMIANTFTTANADDMLYYILLAAQHTGFDMNNDELLICGLTTMRDALLSKLRQYAKYVMPVVFPSVMYHAGKEALESPFELIVMPLCE